MTFKEIVLKLKYPIALILLFVLVENVSFIIEPTFFGKLLDSLIDHLYDHEKIDYFTPIVIWIIVYLINVVVGTPHRLFNGSIYSKTYASIVTEVVIESKCHEDQFYLNTISPKTRIAKWNAFGYGSVLRKNYNTQG